MLSVKVVVRSLVGGILALTLAAGVAAQDEAEIVIRGIWARATVSAQVMGEMSAGGMAGMMATPEAEATEAMGGMGGMMNMVDVSAVYFQLENRGIQPIRLSAASTSVTETVEIHETTMENDVMRMRPLENGVTVAPGETAELRQGGLHIMLLSLNTPLVEGSAIPLTLTFNRLNAAGEVEGETFDILTAAPVMLVAPEPSPFYVSGGWARPTVFAEQPMLMPDATEEPGMAMPGMDVSAGYFTLVNTGDSDDTLIAASTPSVMETQLHTMIMEGDVMRMRELEDGVLVPAGGSAVFEPGANHIMFMGLIEPLVEGTAIPLTLTFASGLEVTVALPVYDRAMMAMMGGQ